jgi:hypothetical protein
MARSANDGILLPIHDIPSLSSFAMALLNAAKDWQDNLQSVLPGYRERVVHVALRPDEGGLNLAMPPDVINDLVEHGAIAGSLAAEEFNLDEHRWRRFLIAMARLEETLDNLATAFKDAPQGGEPFESFLARYADRPASYLQTKAWLAGAMARVTEIVSLGEGWRRQSRIRDGDIPRPETDFRIMSKP